MSVAAFSRKVSRRAVPETVAAAFAQFEASIGGRAALVAALSMADLSPDIEQVLCAIGDPQNDKESLANICYTHGLQPGQVIMAYHKAQMQQVQVLAFAAVVPQVSAVVAEIIRTALPRTEECDTCHGAGKVAAPRKKNRGRKPAPIPCGSCGGKGSVQHDGMSSQQDKVLDLAKLVTKGGGVNVAVQQNNANVPAAGGTNGSPLGQLQQAVQLALTAKAPSLPAASSPIDAVVIPESPNEN